MKKILFALTLFSFLTVLLLSTTSASTLFCLEEGQTIQLCSGQSWECSHSSCQLCVNEISPGVYCQTSLSNCNNACVAFDEGVNENPLPENAPTITLQTPEDDYQQALPGTIEFRYEVTLPRDIDECSLFIDNIQEETDTIAAYGFFSHSLEEGIYSWRISCLTRSSSQFGVITINSEFRNLVIGEIPEEPEEQNDTDSGNGTEEAFDILLTAPENNEVLTGTQEVAFTFNFSDNVILANLTQCSLFLNSAEITKDITEFENTFEFTQTLGIDTYNWHISCGSYGSETRTITISSPVANNGGGGGSGGGGGGGGGSSGSTTTPTNTQTTDNEIEQLEQETNEDEIQTETQQEIQTSGITGSVIGNALKTKTGATIVLAILVGVLGALLYQRRKKIKL